MLAWHDKYNKRMKERVKDEGYPVKNPTDILSDMVSFLKFHTTPEVSKYRTVLAKANINITINFCLLRFLSLSSVNSYG